MGKSCVGNRAPVCFRAGQGVLLSGHHLIRFFPKLYCDGIQCVSVLLLKEKEEQTLNTVEYLLDSDIN